MEDAAEDFVGGSAEGDREVWKIRDLHADRRCGQAVLDFLSSADVGRLVPPLEEGDAGARCQSGSSGNAGSGKRDGRRRSWVLQGD